MHSYYFGGGVKTDLSQLTFCAPPIRLARPASIPSITGLYSRSRSRRRLLTSLPFFFFFFFFFIHFLPSYPPFSLPAVFGLPALDPRVSTKAGCCPVSFQKEVKEEDEGEEYCRVGKKKTGEGKKKSQRRDAVCWLPGKNKKKGSPELNIYIYI